MYNILIRCSIGLFFVAFFEIAMSQNVASNSTTVYVYEIVAVVPSSELRQINLACLPKLQNQPLHQAIQDAIKALTQLRDNTSQVGLLGALQWTSYKGLPKKGSSITISCAELEDAEMILNTFSLLKTGGCMNWIAIKQFKVASIPPNIQYATLKWDAKLHDATPGNELCRMVKGSQVILKNQKKAGVINGQSGFWIEVEYVHVDTQLTYNGWVWETALQLQ